MARWTIVTAALLAACGSGPARSGAGGAGPGDGPATGGGGHGQGGLPGPGGSGGAGSGSDCTSLGRSRGPTQECCRTFGIDACGALLFCAAFDGRTTPTCYPERSRLDGQSCDEDRDCTSGACSATAHACKSVLGQACTAEIGCAPAPTGRPAACDTTTAPARCRETSRELGGLCEADAGCASGHCVHLRCILGPGSACTRDQDCLSGYCAGDSGQRTCSTGMLGSPCRVPADCTEGQCVAGACRVPAPGGPCLIPADCPAVAPYCVNGTCGTGSAGSACNVATECAAAAPHCVGRLCRVEPGRLGESCSIVADCAPGLACNGLPPLLALCDGPRQLREPCTGTAECAQYTFPPALVCDPATRTCLLPSGKECAVPVDCQSQMCLPMGRRCSFDRTRSCSVDAQCVRPDGSTASCTSYSLCQ